MSARYGMTHGTNEQGPVRDVCLATASIALLVVCLFLAACASGLPPNRLGAYVGQDALSRLTLAPLPAQRPILASLVVIFDTGAPGASPALPDELAKVVVERLREDINRITPFFIQSILPNEDIRPRGDLGALLEFGKEHGIEYLALAVLSGTEIEYPWTVQLAWVAHSQPGWRRDNWSLAELAILDVKTGKALLYAEGRGWATLDRPAAPGITQWYPVVWLRPLEPSWRWWPPSYEAAPLTLRVIAMTQAAKQVVLNLQRAWIERFEMEDAKPHGTNQP